jgi:hypothetical protein
VVNGWETALSKRAQPGAITIAAQTTATADREGRIRMVARLRIARRCPPRQGMPNRFAVPGKSGELAPRALTLAL